MDATEVRVVPTSGVNSMMKASKDGKPVLLIGLKEAYQEKPQYQKALRSEYERCKDLDHPHLMKILGFEEVGHYGNCIVMQYEEGRPLSDYYKESHSEDEKRDIVLQIADGLDYLHKNGIVHGALNPTMIYVTKQGDQVRIVNFRQKQADDLLESSATARYVAPEAEDGTVALDGRADIYALGMIMKDLQLGTEYYNIIQRCTGFGRSERYFDIDAFLSDFDHRHSSGGSSRAGRIVLVVALIAVIVAGAVWLVSSQMNNTNEPVQQTSEQAATEMGDSSAQAPDAAVDGAPAESTAEPDQPQNIGQPSATTPQTYTGDQEFLNDLVPQMQKDLDKIYDRALANATTPQEKAAGMAKVRNRVKTYYRGLRGTLKGKSQDAMDAFDQAFASYVNQKNQQAQ
jgi:serine/threonine-protein kinase